MYMSLKKLPTLLVTFVSLNLATTAMAANLKVGEYKGTSNDGRDCYIIITERSINAGYRHGIDSVWNAQSGTRTYTNETIQGNVYKHRSSADGTRLVIDATLNAAGEITTAQINIGLSGLIGKTCTMK